MTVLEMYIGVLNKRERQKIKKFLNKIVQLEINSSIIDTSIDLVYKYRLSHSLFINDAIIAATCIENNFELYTLNVKDFKYLPKLKLYT